MRKENKSIIFLKGIACILVILNHYHGSEMIGNVVYVISHFGVPVFFLTSGYFLYDGADTVEKLPSKMIHIFRLILLHIGLNVLDFITERIILLDNIVRKDIVVKDILSYFNAGSFKTTLFWSNSLFGTGQWFLIALFEGYLVFWIIYKIRIGSFFEKYGIWIALILFLFHIPIRIALIKAGISDIFGINTSDSLFVRNVWFDAIPFMLIGIWLRKNQERIFFSKNRTLLLIAIGAMAVSIGEYFLTVLFLNGNSINSVLYFGTIVSVISAFIWAILFPEGVNGKIGKGFVYVGKNLSMTVYFVHVIVGTYLEYCFSKIGGVQQAINIFFPVVVIIGTLIVSYLIFRMKQSVIQKLQFHIGYILALSICISLLILPVGTEWTMIYKFTGGDEQISIEESLHRDNQSTVLITAQNDSGVTVDAIEIPIVQFIDGGVDRTSVLNEEQYTYYVTYIDNRTLKISMSENISQIRVWTK
ncbi:MAG: acyltransferase [Lachnospiraceae bacterium]|nr:acyltransferase [uncultured Acetatifactor sp.]MCI8288049.1 acyltransferase [Lachnospiraceae bacterium]